MIGVGNPNACACAVCVAANGSSGETNGLPGELGWMPEETFESGMRKTVQWYLANESWWQQVLDGSYQGERLGLKG